MGNFSSLRKSVLVVCVVIVVVIIFGLALMLFWRSKGQGYKVYLSASYEELPDDLYSDLLVIDAQYYSQDEIKALHRNNNKIFSYINVGSIETFRPYYERFSSCQLSPYENWDDEYWMDVTIDDWQAFIVDELAVELLNKGVDGLFVDNLDVYFEYTNEETFNALENIMERLKGYNTDILINGGDSFVLEYLRRFSTLTPILDGVNQECVFTNINWEDGTFITQVEEATNYFQDYLAKVADDKKEVYVIEYCDNTSFAKIVKDKCRASGYKVYLADSVDLDYNGH